MADFLNDAKNVVTNEVNAVKSDISKAMNRIFGGGENLIDKMIDKPIVLAEKILKRSAQSGAITKTGPTWTAESMTWTTTTVPFFLENDFSMNMSNEWKETLDPDGIAGTFRELINGVSMFTDAAQVTMQSEAMSSLSWKGSKFDGFNIQCLFIATRRTINPVDIINILAKSCLPAKLKDYEAEGGVTPATFKIAKDAVTGAISGIGDFLGNTLLKEHKDSVSNVTQTLNNNINDLGMVAPLGYGIHIDNDSANNGGNSVTALKGTTLSLHIGDWFHAPDLVVESISNIQFSKEMIAPPSYAGKNKNDLYDPKPIGSDYGYPLYAKCSIKLRPYTLVDLKRFQSYFTKQPLQTALEKFDGVVGGLQLPS